uniref:Uncharacterized protein n=1 Tax=Lutzomyia longipalpis TaxID=7200 RepID=A0A1B0CA82_LUTLO
MLVKVFGQKAPNKRAWEALLNFPPRLFFIMRGGKIKKKRSSSFILFYFFKS